MNIKQTITATAAILLMASTASAQGLFGKLKDKAVKAGQKKVEQVVTQKAEKAVEEAVTQPADEQTSTADSPARKTDGSGIAADAVSYDVPNPNTDWDVPTDYTKVALGLPKNDSGDKPALQKPRDCVSYAAFQIPRSREAGSPAKVFYNADRRRIYTINYVTYADGSKKIDRTLSIIDSLAFYQIDHEKKTITKVALSTVQNAAMYGVVDHEHAVDVKDISSEAGRWCYNPSGYSKTTRELFGQEVKEEGRSGRWVDLETGIDLALDEGGGKDIFVRNIHVGLFYPELYDLPGGYKWQVMDFSKGMQRMDELQERVRQMQEQMGGMKMK